MTALFASWPSRNLALVVLVVALVLGCILFAGVVIGAYNKQARRLKAWQESVKPCNKEYGC